MSEKIYTLRIDETIFEKVKELADKNKRSIAKQIEYILDSYFAEPPAEKELFRSAETDVLITRLAELLNQHGGITGQINPPSNQ